MTSTCICPLEQMAATTLSSAILLMFLFVCSVFCHSSISFTRDKLFFLSEQLIFFPILLFLYIVHYFCLFLDLCYIPSLLYYSYVCLHFVCTLFLVYVNILGYKALLILCVFCFVLCICAVLPHRKQLYFISHAFKLVLNQVHEVLRMC